MTTEGSQPVSERPTEPRGIVARTLSDLGAGFRELRWGPVLLFGIASGILMPLTLLQAGVLAFVAGIVPVGVGLLLARRVPGHFGLHGFMTGLIGALVASVLLGIVINVTPYGAQLAAASGLIGVGADGAPIDPTTLDPGVLEVLLAQAWITTGGFIGISLIVFCTFGATTAGRAEVRNRELRAEVEARGGGLEKPGTVRNVEDLRGLSLPQLGSYVNALFKKKGFTFKDYRFTHKDRYLDLWLSHEGQPWHLRLCVADRVTPGPVESLIQDMKRESCRHGVVITSTEFTPGATKAAKDRPIVLIDGQTLYDIAN
ncbi:MAG: restriction endonuclease [Chloroflexi bacterium]|nr:restriction endonuclease [Chloroflexota bacterium]